MAKRLYMTTADYVTIAVSPALVMAMVGSLVYFLIEVLYVGEYRARLMYVFALFVFAAVLIARISIEEGTEYASLFALPLGLATFFVLWKFVEHPSPFSALINIVLMVIVWWCAHKLTWDCTLIDDKEDSSGEGLMQRIGVEEADGRQESLTVDSEWMADKSDAAPWWQLIVKPKKVKHTPGVWVLYFSLAALPLFGIGQHWVPPSEVGRRRFVFSLLLVYVASALALLVTTSFLGLRRYLRQRHVEMPAPMAATWVGIGAVLIVLVMLLAALIPRPHAEYAISQVPWQATSPGGMSSARFGSGNGGSDEYDPAGSAIKEDAPPGDAVQKDAKGDPVDSDEGKSSGNPGGETEAEGKSGKAEFSPEDRTNSAESNSEAGQQPTDDSGKEASSNSSGEQAANELDETEENEDAPSGRPAKATLPEHSADERPFTLPQIPPLDLGILTGALKLILYAAGAIFVAVFVWRNRHALAQAVRDILRQLQELLARLFGGGTTTAETMEEQATKSQPRHRTFAEYRNPFATGDHRRVPPEELVRYTFEAFEAWAHDAGYPRSLDQTPAELVRNAVEPQTPLAEAARRMTRLYSEVAYASGHISPAAAESLREFWSLMQASSGQLIAR